MSEAAEHVISDIAATMEYDIKRVFRVQQRFTGAVTDQLRRHTGLSINDVLAGVHPLRSDLLERLSAELDASPTMMHAADYPSNIINWIQQIISDQDEDVLGCYLPQQRAVELYWLPIILCSRQMKCDVQRLGLVVLLHEMSHAFSHVGLNVDQEALGDGFIQVSREIKEGVAQFWTHHVLLARPAWRHVFEVFIQLTKQQSGLYRAFMPWVPAADFAGQQGYDAYIRKPAGNTPNLPPQLSIREGLRRTLLGPIRNNPRISLAEVDALLSNEAATRFSEYAVSVF